MTVIELIFWLSGAGFEKVKQAAIAYFDLMKFQLEYPLRQLDPLTCDDGFLVFHAWKYLIPTIKDETNESYRSRIANAYINQLQAGSAIGLEQILNRLGVDFVTIEERKEGSPWDLIIITTPTDGYSGNQELLDNLIQRFGRTCRRYTVEEFQSLSIETFGVGFEMDYQVEQAGFYIAPDVPTAMTTEWTTLAPSTMIGIGFGADNVSADVDWGDGNAETFTGVNTELTHTYADAGVYVVKVTGQVHLRDLTANATRNMASTLCTNISAMGTGVEYQSCNAMFHSISTDKFSFEDSPDLSSCSTLDNMFFGCTNFNQPVGDWDVSNVQNFYRMFINCSSFNQPLNNWSTDNMSNLSGTFYGCSSFNQDLDNWDVSQVGYFTSTFLNCVAFNGNVTTWDTSGGTLLSSMFNGCPDFNQDVSGFDLSNATAIDNMFANCHDFNQDLSSWDTSNIENMYRTFINCLSINQDFKDWDVENVSSFDQFNYNAANLTAEKLPFFKPYTTKWTTTAPGTEIEIGLGQNNVSARIDWGDGNIETFTGSSTTVTHTYAAIGNYVVRIDGRTHLSTSFSANNDINSSICTEISALGSGVKYQSLRDMFAYVSGDKFTFTDVPDLTECTSIRFVFYQANLFNQPVGDWDLSNVTDFTIPFYNCWEFNQPLTNWQVGGNTLSSFFYGCSKFNQPLSHWDVSNIVVFTSMFQGANDFNQDISNWDTSSAIVANAMFRSASSFNQDISGWDLTGVSNFTQFFYYASAFNQDISGWDMSNATSMNVMFHAAVAFNQDISGWDTGLVTDMTKMFYWAAAFDQDVSNWDVKNVTAYANFETGLSDHKLPSFGLVNDDLNLHFKISDLQTLFQDTAGIVPVTTHGQAVALIVDRSGNGFNATQSDVTKRPIYETDGTYHWLVANGANTIMDLPIGYDGARDGNNTAVSSVRITAGGYNYVFGSNNDRGLEQIVLNGLIRPFCTQVNGALVANGTTYNVTTDRIYSSDYVNDNGSSVAELRGWNDQNLEASITRATADKSIQTYSWLFQGYSASSAGFFGGRLYETTIFNSQSSDAHRNIVEECLERRCNVVLP